MLHCFQWFLVKPLCHAISAFRSSLFTASSLVGQLYRQYLLFYFLRIFQVFWTYWLLFQEYSILGLHQHPNSLPTYFSKLECVLRSYWLTVRFHCFLKYVSDGELDIITLHNSTLCSWELFILGVSEKFNKGVLGELYTFQKCFLVIWVIF